MKRSAVVLSFALVVHQAAGRSAVAQIVPVSPGPAFYALPLPAWGGVVQNLYPAIQSQAMLSPQFASLHSVLGPINSRLLENPLSGVQSLEFVRFMPKRYRERPEAFAGLDEGRQIAGIARGVNAASRGLDSEATELAAKVRSGQASPEDVRRLAQIQINNFYLSSEVRADVHGALTGVAVADAADDPRRPALSRMKRIASKPAEEQGPAFDNDGRKATSVDDDAPAVPAYESVERPLRASEQRGGLMKATSRKTASKRNGSASGRSNNTKDKIIAALGLQPLPGEGGYYKETYRSGIQVPVPLKDGEQPVTRHLGTAIYYVVTPKEFSALHKLKSDEVFHFYGGDPVEMLQISETGEVQTIILGRDVLKGQQVQVTVPAGTWQGTRLLKGGKYALLGTTVFPAFEFADFELGKRAELTGRFPHLAKQIEKFTRE